jgi:hypothetical protein
LDNNQYGAPLSGLDPLAWLSGLQFKNPMSGVEGASLSGAGGEGTGGFLPGMKGGLGLDALSDLLQQQRGEGEGVGPGQAGDLLRVIGGNIGQGTMAGGGQGYAIAGQTSASPTQGAASPYVTAGQTSGGTIDPKIMALLGIAQKGLGVAERAYGSGGQTPVEQPGTQPETLSGFPTGGAFDPTGQMQTKAFQDFRAGERGAFGDPNVQSLLESFGLASPTGYSANQTLQPLPGSQMSTLDMLRENLPPGSPTSGYGAGLTPTSMTFTNTFGGGSQTGDQAGIQTLLEAGFTPDQIQLLFGGAEQSLTGGALPDLSGLPGEISGVTQQRLSALPPAPNVPGTNWFGAAQGGIGGALGLLNLIQATESGSIPGGIGGGLQTAGGLAQLLRSSPQLASSLGLTPGMLGGASAGASGLGGLLGIYGGIQALQDGNPVGAVTGLGGGALSTYQALQALSSLYPGLTGGTALPSAGALGGSALEAISPALAGSLGIGSGAIGAANLAALSQPAVAAALGIAPGAAGTAGSAGAAGGAAAGGASAAAAGVGGVLAAAMAPLMIGSMIQGWDPWSEAFSKSMGAYHKFVPELMRGQGQQGTAFSVLQQSLPYVQSKEELGQLLNTYKNYLGTTTGIGLEDRSGTGDPYRLTAIPGTGPVTHGQQTPSIDWGPREQMLQQAIDAYLPMLPGERITSQYGQPGGGLAGDAGMRLWTQFLDREKNAPYYVPQEVPGTRVPGGEGADWFTNATPAGFTTKDALAQTGALVTPGAYLTYGQPGYDYAGAGFPEPGQYFGSISPYWQQLMASGMGMGGPQQAPPGFPPSMLPGLPQPHVEDSTGLMELMSGLAPAGQASQLAGQTLLPEDEILNMFQQYS